MADRDAAGLPYTTPEHITTLRQEYEAKAILGGTEATEACFNYCWALVHSKNSKDVNRGLELTLALLSGDPADGRELLYLKSVAQYRLRHSLEARRTLQELLQEYPDFRQAESLLEHVESDIVRDGLVGVGVGAAVIGVIGAIAVSVLKKR